MKITSAFFGLSFFCFSLVSFAESSCQVFTAARAISGERVVVIVGKRDRDFEVNGVITRSFVRIEVEGTQTVLAKCAGDLEVPSWGYTKACGYRITDISYAGECMLSDP